MQLTCDEKESSFKTNSLSLSTGEDHRQFLTLGPVRGTDVVAAQFNILFFIHVGNAYVLALEIESQESIRTPKLIDRLIH